MGNKKKDYPEKLAIQSTQDDEKQNKKQDTICFGRHYMQENKYNVNKM